MSVAALSRAEPRPRFVPIVLLCLASLLVTACHHHHPSPPALMVGRLVVTADRQEVIAGEQVALQASVTAASAVSAITWTLDGAPVGSGPMTSVTLSAPGTAVATATATLEDGTKLEGGTVLSVYPSTGGAGLGFGNPGSTPGDVDGDGRVGIRDALLVRSLLDGNTALAAGMDLAAGDMNANGVFDDEDVGLVQDIVQDQASLPTVLRPATGHPGTQVQVIGPALAELGSSVEVQFGDEPPVQVFRPRLGYANTWVPLSLDGKLPPGTTTAIPVRVLVGGQVVDELSFGASPIPAPRANRTADQALMALPETLAAAVRSATQSLGPAFSAFATDPQQTAAVGAVLSGALVDLDRAVAQMRDLLAQATPQQKDLMYAVARANGLEDYLDQLAGLSLGPAGTAPAHLAPTTSARVVLSLVCELQELKSQLKTPARVATTVCAVVGVTAILFPPSAAVTAAVLGVCSNVLAAVSIADLALAFVPATPARLDVTTSPPTLKEGEATEITVSYRLGVGSAICSGVFEGVVQKLFAKLGETIASFVPTRRQAWELAKTWPVNSTTGNLVKEITEQIESFFESAAGVIGAIQLINTELQSLQNALCGGLPGGATFELEPGVALASVPSPPSAGMVMVPPVGSTARATFTCQPAQGMTMPMTVQFDAAFFCGSHSITGRGQVVCGGVGNVVICEDDNGSLLDDIFELRVDGQTLLAPSAPVVRVCTPSLPLTAGPHVAELVGRAAPDGVGTYYIEFQGPVQNVSGPPLSGSNLVPGLTFVWTFDVVAQ